MLTKEITSLQHPIVKMVAKLSSSKEFRHLKGQVPISGFKQIHEMEQIDLLFTTRQWIDALPGKEKIIVTEAILKKMGGISQLEPAIALVPIPKWVCLAKKKWVLGLDQIRDPGNLGTLLRTALALGWEGAFLTKSCVDPYNDKALRSAKGATFRLPLQMGNLATMHECIAGSNRPVWVADATGSSIELAPKADGAFLILGNEGEGVSIELKKKFPLLSIPIVQMESLNVAAAGAILMDRLRHG